MTGDGRPSPARGGPSEPALLPDWVEAILAEDDGPPLPAVSSARRATLDALPSDRKRLIVVVSLYGPIRVHEALALVAPGATRERRQAMAASLANLAREGRIERIAPGLYDALRVTPTIPPGRRVFIP